MFLDGMLYGEKYLFYFFFIFKAWGGLWHRKRGLKSWKQIRKSISKVRVVVYTGSADKSLARPRRKQATATEDFDFDISYL
jgi:hypothetical protein